MSYLKRNSIKGQEQEPNYEDFVPECIIWSCREVADWISKLGYPEYTETFLANFINGRKLILMDSSHFSQLGIIDFQHIKALSLAVRKLLGIEEPNANRSICLPERHPLCLFLLSKARTGEEANRLTYTNFIMDNKLVHS
ncbi:PREDICTED: sterile alpha motif domain-containing protein 15-like [Priapulus caudatus]|uniref:Sterile alpha motif domain-containing protein 15-like n=1 Tax=Priapulus caudatus TaxID=37621 RepID=A0ABM1E033_PRICU|nr:PREDICTED: sterile alpha motif domain-containing protein 15-like [Priapulus caudatus]